MQTKLTFFYNIPPHELPSQACFTLLVHDHLPLMTPYCYKFHASIFPSWRMNFLPPLRPVQSGNVWRLNIIKHCVVTKHADVELRDKRYQTCLNEQNVLQ